jgi:carboxyl-terminal processing protease
VSSDVALPSVNEFLPIGESDLPNALPWNKIEPVGWKKDWQGLTLSNSEIPNLKANLAQKSEERQQSLEEFKFLQEQIEWRRLRYEEKAISLNLEQRIDRKIKDQEYIDQLDKAYEKLTPDAYESEEFILKVAEEQEALSKKNLKANGTEPALAEKKSEEEERPNFDIYLRESARIMADWIQLQGSEDGILAAER